MEKRHVVGQHLCRHPLVQAVTRRPVAKEKVAHNRRLKLLNC